MSEARIPEPFQSAMRVSLQHFAMVTYRVPAERLRQNIPQTLELDTRIDQVGNEYGFVSAVMFQNTDFRAFSIPWPRLTFLQINYRTYVRYHGNPAVWFFLMVQQSFVANLYRAILKTPTYVAPIQLNYERQVQGYRSYCLDSDSPQHRLHVDIEGTDVPLVSDVTLGTPEEMVRFFTDRFEGYFYETSTRRISCLPVWHESINPQPGRPRRITIGLFEQLGILLPEEKPEPIQVLLQPNIHFYALSLRRNVVRGT
jgi:uncharacterized protein YqjF (DUF2071 family)